MSKTVLQPKCIGCEHNVHYNDFVPKRSKGIMMRYGFRYCTGGNKARQFKRGDPKIYVPQWCPKRKNPAELRLYGFKDLDSYYMHSSISASLGIPIVPAAHRYAVHFEGHTDLTASEFYKRSHHEPISSLVSIAVQNNQVLEIDDGIKPVCFYRTEAGLEPVYSFDTEKAKKNIRKGSGEQDEY